MFFGHSNFDPERKHGTIMVGSGCCAGTLLLLSSTLLDATLAGSIRPLARHWLRNLDTRGFKHSRHLGSLLVGPHSFKVRAHVVGEGKIDIRCRPEVSESSPGSRVRRFECYYDLFEWLRNMCGLNEMIGPDCGECQGVKAWGSELRAGATEAWVRQQLMSPTGRALQSLPGEVMGAHELWGREFP